MNAHPSALQSLMHKRWLVTDEDQLDKIVSFITQDRITSAREFCKNESLRNALKINYPDLALKKLPPKVTQKVISQIVEKMPANIFNEIRDRNKNSILDFENAVRNYGLKMYQDEVLNELGEIKVNRFSNMHIFNHSLSSLSSSSSSSEEEPPLRKKYKSTTTSEDESTTIIHSAADDKKDVLTA